MMDTKTRAEKILKIMGYHEIDTEFSEVLPTIIDQLDEAVWDGYRKGFAVMREKAVRITEYLDFEKLGHPSNLSDIIRAMEADK